MQELSNRQRLFYVNSEQLYEVWHAAALQVRSHRYGMKWQKSGQHEYLVRLHNAKGNGRSLGPRSPETAAIYENFVEGKARADERFKSLSEQMTEQARLNRAVQIDRVPNLVAKILLELDISPARDDFCVVGTHALFAYEAMAGVQFKDELLASGDVDLMYDPRKKLTVVSGRLDAQGLLGVLKRADKSFEPIKKNGFRATNKEGFMVDLIMPKRDMREKDLVRFASEDLVAAEVHNLHWLTNAPSLRATAIASNGYPIRMRVPDPRAFMLHKAWLSEQVDRDPVKKPRDHQQAQLVFEALKKYLPIYPLKDKHLRYLPKGMLAEWLTKQPNQDTSASSKFLNM